MDASLILPEDPYYLPGYGGYCPELKFRVSETYGKATHRILKKTNYGNKDKMDLPCPKKRSAEKKTLVDYNDNTDDFIGFLQTRQNQPNSLYKYPVIPGYTGFVPRLRSSFGYGFSNSVKDAIKMYDRDDYLNKKELQRLEDVRKRRKLEKAQYIEDLKLEIYDNF